MSSKKKDPPEPMEEKELPAQESEKAPEAPQPEPEKAPEKEPEKPAEPPAEAQLKAEKDKYLRLLAEYDNYRKRSAKEREKAVANLERIEKKLSNESFVSRAPEAVVNAEREKADKARALIEKLDASAAAMKA